MKFMNMKRFGATVMAGALALSMAAPAFAADTAPTTTFTGKYEPITLNVTVPQTGSALINPYGLPVTLDEETVISGEQITTGAALLIKNQSKVALAVTAKVTGTEKGDAKLVATVAESDTAKNIAAKFEAFKAPGVLDDTDELELNAMFAALKSENADLSADITDSENATTGDLVLREGDEEGLTQDGGAAFIRLSGNVVKAPTAAWAAADGFEAKVVFSFEPSEYVGTVELTAAATEVASDGTLDITVKLPAGVKAVANSAKWTADKTTYMTVAGKTSTATEITGTVTGVKKATSATNITVEFVGNDGITYRGTIAIKCVDPA